MPDMKVENNKVVYLNDSNETIYSLPTSAGNENDVLKLNGSGELIFTAAVSDEVTFTATTAGDWTVEPSLVNDALDELAARVKTLETTVAAQAITISDLEASVDALENPPAP